MLGPCAVSAQGGGDESEAPSLPADERGLGLVRLLAPRGSPDFSLLTALVAITFLPATLVGAAASSNIAESDIIYFSTKLLETGSLRGKATDKAGESLAGARVTVEGLGPLTESSEAGNLALDRIQGVGRDSPFSLALL